MRMIVGGMMAVMLAAAAGCGKDEVAAAPTVPMAEAEDTGPRPAPSVARGESSLEARVVAALDHASAVRVMRLDPAGPGRATDCRVARCIEGNAIETALLVRDPATSSHALSVVRDWMVDAASVDADCEPAYHQALVFKAQGSEYALLLDRECGAYLLAVDDRLRAQGTVEVPEADPLVDVLLRGEASMAVDDEPAQDEGVEAPAEPDAGGTPLP